VTGANGFIGSHLVEALLRRGYLVRCLVRPTSDLTFIRSLPVEWATGDLREAGALAAACDGVHAVCHCAAVTRAMDEATFYRVNTEATQALADACLRSAPGVSRFVFLSSVAASGPAPSRDKPVGESDAPHPITWYGRSKLAAEQALLALSDELPVTILRPGPVFGPRDRDVLAYFRWVARGLALQAGREARWASFAYVLDVVSLILRALESDVARGRTYNAVSYDHTHREFAQLIAQALGRRALHVALPKAMLTPIGRFFDLQGRLTGRPGLLNSQKVLDMKERYNLYSGARAAAELGFMPQLDFAQAVAETARWYRDHGWL
jgi:nucleoside-diphosphate-sugar epimerase